MSYLLDTNVISELRKPAGRAHEGVRRWTAEQSPSGLYLSSITVLEIELGIRRLARRDEGRAARLLTWLEDDVLDVFAGRVLPVDVAVARQAADLHVPDPRPERDALIAATAIVHGLTVVTRNVRDFADSRVKVLDPWEADA